MKKLSLSIVVFFSFLGQLQAGDTIKGDTSGSYSVDAPTSSVSEN
jgi:hypothetical protein